MLFRRRRPASLYDRIRNFVWPRRSFARSALYFSKRVLRITATPHAVAAGVAAGAFASFFPFIGFHFVLAALFAFIIRGNILASALGTAVGNPLTFPLIWGSTYELGRFILYGGTPDIAREFAFGQVLMHLRFGELWTPLLKPMTIGAIPLGLTVATILYVFTRWATIAFRERRQQRLKERARLRAAAAVAGGQ